MDCYFKNDNIWNGKSSINIFLQLKLFSTQIKQIYTDNYPDNFIIKQIVAQTFHNRQ